MQETAIDSNLVFVISVVIPSVLLISIAIARTRKSLIENSKLTKEVVSSVESYTTKMDDKLNQLIFLSLEMQKQIRNMNSAIQDNREAIEALQVPSVDDLI